MKVGKEIRSGSPKLTSNKFGSKIISLAAVAGLLLMPLQVTLSTAQAGYDPVQLAQMWEMVKAVEEGRDQDPVHAAQVREFLAVYGDTSSAPASNSVSAAPAGQYAHLDAAQIAAMWDMVRAVEEGRDQDPVHAAQAAAFKAAHGGATAEAPAPTSQPAYTTQAKTSAPAPAPVITNSNPLSGLNFYVNNYGPAANQANSWRYSRPGDAAKMDILAAAPTAQWLGGWSGDVESAVRRLTSSASAQGQAAVMVAYNIPQRDCGGHSAGGTADYQSWIGGIARGIGSNHAVVILEPDALSLMDCLSEWDKQKRMELLASAVSILKSNANTRVYIDAGHSGWLSADTMAPRLEKANIAKADGFALNVSNFMTTGDETAYGAQLSQRLGGKHFVIDTSRNGNGSNGEWCNPWGRAIGQKPTTSTGNQLIDAYLWIKTPGESDGTCNGGPSAGTWWPDYALSLVR